MTGMRQQGFGMLEMLAVLVLGVLLAAGVLATLDGDWQRARLHDDARRHAQLAAATARYLEVRRDLLAGELPLAVATALPLAQLQAAGYLPAGFAPQNTRGHQACILLLASAGQVEALVSASGGQAPGAADLAEMAAAAGPGAGYLEPEAPLRARGAFNTWTLDTASLQRFAGAACPGGPIAPGRLASLVRQPLGAAGDAPAYLARRGAAADAPWNVMETPLAMGASAVAMAGGACGADAAIALDAERSLLSCAANGAWKRQASGRTWKETRPGYAALPAGDTPGDVRMTADQGRAFVARTGNEWQALAVNQDGHLDVAAQARAGSLVTRDHLDAGSGTAAGTLEAGRDVRASGMVIGRRVESRTGAMAGSYWVNGYDIAAGMACNQPNAKVAPDGTRSTLHPIGAMMRDNKGIVLSCQAPSNQFRYLNGKLTP